MSTRRWQGAQLKLASTLARWWRFFAAGRSSVVEELCLEG
jgi:hypothetical protein